MVRSLLAQPHETRRKFITYNKFADQIATAARLVFVNITLLFIVHKHTTYFMQNLAYVISKLTLTNRRSRYEAVGNEGDSKCPSLSLKCDPESKVRSYDGTCNNLQKPEWGAMSKPYARFFRPMYEDGKREICDVY